MDLTTRYMGLELNCPLIASASPLTSKLGNILRLEEAGAGAVVLPSLFEELIETDLEGAHMGAKPYVELVEKAAAVAGIPIIASLNGTSTEGWLTHARDLEKAGAAALELNIYFIPTDLDMSGEEVERRYLDIVRSVRERVKIPVAVKLGPYFSAFGNLARRLADGGADALVLFNRFYQPDIDIGSLRLENDLRLSDRHEIRLPMLWISVLAGRVRSSLAASSGVETSEEVIKYLLAGADVVMTTSALLRFGPGYLATLRDGLVAWMEAHGVDKVKAIRGHLSHLELGCCDPLFDRGNYLDILNTRAREAG